MISRHQTAAKHGAEAGKRKSWRYVTYIALRLAPVYRTQVSTAGVTSLFALAASRRGVGDGKISISAEANEKKRLLARRRYQRNFTIAEVKAGVW
jgi:hypothetical protein